MNKSFITLTLLFLFAFTSTAHAVTLPTFPSCVNPQGTVKSTYSEGTHGVPGSANSYLGSDTVYNVLGDSVTQCFCSDDGQGIQSNWFAVEQLSEEEIQDLKNDGWTLIPNGLAWGLADKPYMVKNTNYSCGTSRVGGDSSTNSGSSSNPSVLGLATTGNGIVMMLSGFGALLAIILARRLRRNGK